MRPRSGMSPRNVSQPASQAGFATPESSRKTQGLAQVGNRHQIVHISPEVSGGGTRDAGDRWGGEESPLPTLHPEPGCPEEERDG